MKDTELNLRNLIEGISNTHYGWYKVNVHWTGKIVS